MKDYKKIMKEYKKIKTVKAKIFEKGDEDGILHRYGEDAKNIENGCGPDLVPYISTLENQQFRGEWGKNYLCVGINGEKWLVAKEIFEGTYEEVQK